MEFGVVPNSKPEILNSTLHPKNIITKRIFTYFYLMRTRDIEKERLVKEKAMELVVKGGLENFSVNKLAKECGISVATLYIYYKDKDDLITKVAIEEFQRRSEGRFQPCIHDVDRINLVERQMRQISNEHEGGAEPGNTRRLI